MAHHYPTDHSMRRWGTSMTIATVVLAFYFIALFYFAVADQASHMANQTATQTFEQPH